MFVDEFYENAPEELKDAMQYIYEYLLVATSQDDSADSYRNNGMPRSQLACNMEPIPTDSTLAEWSFTQFGGILHRAKKIWWKLTTFTQVWVLMNHAYQVVLSSLLTKFVLKVLWSLDQWLGCIFPMDLVCIHAYLGCIQVCRGLPSSTPMFWPYGI